MDGGVEMTMIQEHIDVQKSDFGGGSVPSEHYPFITIILIYIYICNCHTVIFSVFNIYILKKLPFIH